MELDFSRLERAFNPQTVAVVGEKGPHHHWLLAESEYKGKLYSVQVDPKEFEGIKALGIENYTSLMDVPGPVDLVIVTVPRQVAPRILEDCINKGVAAAHFYTSGFAETDTEEGIRLEMQMVERSKQADFYLIGPNCMGIYNPSIGLKQAAREPSGFTGPVGFISQSGTHAVTFSYEAYLQGVGIDKSVSFGNGRVLDAADYLEYFSRDQSIRAIGMYLEGVRNGARFLKVLKGVAEKKPVVIWKGGRTEEGSRAIASHTGSMAVTQAVWEAAIRQCGAVVVSSLEELVDTLNAIIYLRPVTGPRVGIAGGSGGQSVAVADVFAEYGLKVPLLTDESYNQLASFFKLIGAGYRNPIDPGVNRREMRRIMDILDADANIDNLVMMTNVGSQTRSAEQVENDLNMLIELRQKSRKPVSVILGYNNPETIHETMAVIEKLHQGGIPLFVSSVRGARAIRNTLQYYKMKSG